MTSFGAPTLELPSNGFAHVSKAKKKRKGNSRRPVSEPLSLENQVKLTRQEFQSSEEWAGFREFLGGIEQELSGRHSVKRGLCLGLGSPSASTDSRCQLVLLLDLVNRFGIDLSAVEIYDPLFIEDDVSQLQSLGLSILPENLGGRHTIDEGTLLYLPHCPMVLLERLLRVNWSRGKLETLVLVGNDVREWIEGRRSHQAKYPCIERLVPFLSSISFPPDAFGLTRTAFAGMSFQVVKFDASQAQSPGAAEPVLSVPAPSRKKKRWPTTNAETPRPALLPADQGFWDLPEEDSSLAQDLEVL